MYIYIRCTVYTHQRHTDTEEVKMRHTQTTKNNYFESHVQHLLPLPSPLNNDERRLLQPLQRRRLLRSRRRESTNNIIIIIYTYYRRHCGDGTQQCIQAASMCSGIADRGNWDTIILRL